MELGKRIKQIRTSKGISARYVAVTLGVDPSTLCKWENDSRSVRADILPDLARALGVKIQDFYADEVDETPIKSNTA